MEEFRDERLERITTLVAESRGFARARHRLVIYGVCRDCQRGAGPGDYRVPERKPSGNHEPDALHHEGMLTGGGYRLDYLTGFGVSEGERDHCGGGKDRRPENFLDFALAGLLVASEDEVALSYLFARLEYYLWYISSR